MGENPSLALAKACSDPQSLSIDELTILGSYFSIVMSPIDRAYKIEQRSGLYRGMWIELLQRNLPLVLLTTAGRTWWGTEKAFYPPEFQSVANAIVESSPTEGECHLVDWQQRINDASSVN